MTQKKTYLSWLLGLICAFSLMIVFLITSVEAVAYWTPHYYENEYTRLPMMSIWRWTTCFT